MDPPSFRSAVETQAANNVSGVKDRGAVLPPERNGASKQKLAGIRFERIQVGEVRTEHGTGGRAAPVLFLHGWGVGPRSYAASLNRLSRMGCRVLAPALPGFGGTASLADNLCSFPGYARWLSDYLDAAGVDERVVVVGHSFGGGVAVQFAHDFTQRVRAVVACNGVGGLVGLGAHERPWWEWGRQLGSDLFALESLLKVLPAVMGQAVPNIMSNPSALWRVGEVVRHADLRREALVISRRGVPVTLVWSDRDRLISHGNFVSMCKACGVEGVVVPGHHSWVIGDPSRFCDIVLRALVEAGVVEEALPGLTA